MDSDCSVFEKVSSLTAQFNLFGSSMGVPSLSQFQRMSKNFLSKKFFISTVLSIACSRKVYLNISNFSIQFSLQRKPI